MKINGTPPNPMPGAAAPAKPGTARTGPAASSQLEVSLSSLATRLNRIESEAAAPFDAARVESLKQAIRDGQFKVNAGVVADRLIDELKLMLNRKPAG